MPKLSPELEKARALKVVKGLNRNNFNASALARESGVSPQAIAKKIKRPIVQKTLSDYLKKHFSQKYIKDKLREGLKANKVVGYLNNKTEGVEKVSDEFVEVPDFHCRHKYLVTLLECQGNIKSNGKNGDTHIHITIEQKEKLRERIQSSFGRAISFAD